MDDEMAVLEAKERALAAQYEELRAVLEERRQAMSEVQIAMNTIIIDRLAVGARMDQLEKGKVGQ